MRIFVNRQFRKFAVDNAISGDSLCKAIREISTGLAHANLGGGVYKQRIARKGQGKSGGFRTIIFFRAHKTAFFILGFAKNEQDNLERNEIAGLKDLAGRMLNYDEQTIALALKNGALREVVCEENVSQPGLRGHP
jgi:hypothetical protein